MKMINIILMGTGLVLGFLVLRSAFYYFYELYHTPTADLTAEMKDMIRKNGVLHFTAKKNATNILNMGILPNQRKAMSPNEKGLVWLYPNDEEKFEEMWDRIHIKRDQANCFVVVKNLSDEQLRTMHYRKSDGAIAYRGTLRTDRMKIQDTPRG